MTIPHLNEALIRSHATAQSFERGESYYRNGSVASLTQRGSCLMGAVEGSEYEPYRVSIQFDAGGLTSATCTCPYNFEGWCKHIVATLLTSLHHPDQIEQRSPLEVLLRPLNRDQLQTLLQALTTEQPELIDQIERQIQHLFAQPVAQAASKKMVRRTMVDPQPFRRQVQQILNSAGGDWDDAPALEEISALVDKADDFTVQGDGNNALVILRAITDAYVESWMNLDGSSGESGMFFEELDAALAEAILSADLSAADRQDWQRQLPVWEDEVDQYGIDDAFAKSKTALNQGWDDPQLQSILQGKVTHFPGPEGEESYSVKTLIQIRLAILERQDNYNAYLNLARAAGQTKAYLTMLVRLGRIEEVMTEAKQQLHSADAALAVAQALRERGELAQALEIAEAGLDLPGILKAQLALWTSELAEGMGQQGKGLQARIIAFKDTPTLANYLKIEELADASEWPKLQRSLLKSLRQQDDAFTSEAKVDIFLREGLLEDAIQSAQQLSSFQADLIHRVMDAAMEQRPEWVIDNARRRAESIMDQGKAKYYQAAVEWLIKARDAYRQADRQQEWQTYYAELLQKHSRKRKLINLLNALKRER